MQVLSSKQTKIHAKVFIINNKNIYLIAKYYGAPSGIQSKSI